MNHVSKIMIIIIRIKKKKIKTKTNIEKLHGRGREESIKRDFFYFLFFFSSILFKIYGNWIVEFYRSKR